MTFYFYFYSLIVGKIEIVINVEDQEFIVKYESGIGLVKVLK